MQRRLSALDVYKRLTELHRELDQMADECWSVAGETALRAAALSVRTLASAFFMSMDPDGSHPRDDLVKRPPKDG